MLSTGADAASFLLGQRGRVQAKSIAAIDSRLRAKVRGTRCSTPTLALSFPDTVAVLVAGFLSVHVGQLPEPRSKVRQAVELEISVVGTCEPKRNDETVLTRMIFFRVYTHRRPTTTASPRSCLRPRTRSAGRRRTDSCPDPCRSSPSCRRGSRRCLAPRRDLGIEGKNCECLDTFDQTLPRATTIRYL